MVQRGGISIRGEAFVGAALIRQRPVQQKASRGELREHLYEDGEDEDEEGVVVLGAHAVVEPLAVVVEVQDALVACAAVLAPLGHVARAEVTEERVGVRRVLRGEGEDEEVRRARDDARWPTRTTASRGDEPDCACRPRGPCPPP